MLCSPVSAGDHSHHCRVALVPYAVPARLPKASLHVSFWSLSVLWPLFVLSIFISNAKQ